MRISLPGSKEIAEASTYQLLLWWCLCPLEPEDQMMTEEELRARLEEDPAHVETICIATGLGFNAN